MAKKDTTDDPAALLAADAKELARLKDLDKILNRIARAEADRNEASDEIRRLWRKVEREGHPIQEARSRFVRLVTTQTPKT